MRDEKFYKKIFGQNFSLVKTKPDEDFVQIFDVHSITALDNIIIENGGELTVPTMELKNNEKVAYYSDPNGMIFALKELKEKNPSLA